MFRLGFSYLRGRGVLVDNEKALTLLADAAGKGNIRAKAEYARQLLRGREGFINIFRGVYLFVVNFIEGLKIASKDLNDERLLY